MEAVYFPEFDGERVKAENRSCLFSQIQWRRRKDGKEKLLIFPKFNGEGRKRKVKAVYLPKFNGAGEKAENRGCLLSRIDGEGEKAENRGCLLSQIQWRRRKSGK